MVEKLKSSNLLHFSFLIKTLIVITAADASVVKAIVINNTSVWEGQLTLKHTTIEKNNHTGISLIF